MHPVRRTSDSTSRDRGAFAEIDNRQAHMVLIAGSLLVLTLQIGSGLAQNWDVAGGQLIYALLFFILLTYCERNRWSIDRYWQAPNNAKKIKVQK